MKYSLSLDYVRFGKRKTYEIPTIWNNAIHSFFLVIAMRIVQKWNDDESAVIMRSKDNRFPLKTTASRSNGL